MEKICNICGKLLPYTEYHSNGLYKGKKKYKPNCKSCSKIIRKDKLLGIKLLICNGTLECLICHYSKCPEALEFHHLNPSEDRKSVV